MHLVAPPGSSGSPAVDCGIDRHDGVVIARLPRLEGVMQEYHPHEGATLYAMDGLAIDLFDLNNPRTKWWKVRVLARGFKLDYPEPMWQCASQELTYDTVATLLDTTALRYYDDRVLHMRAYSHGPWIDLTKGLTNGEETQDQPNDDPQPDGLPAR